MDSNNRIQILGGIILGFRLEDIQEGEPITLLLSNNDKSDIISMDIKDKYPMFERITYNFEYNNFNEFYRREIKTSF